MIAIPKWAYYAVGIVVALIIAFYIGKRKGATDEKLSQNQAQIDTANAITRADSAKADTARKKSVNADSALGTIRAKLKVIHDTTYLPGDKPGTVDTVANKTLAHLVYAVDSAKIAHKEEQKQQDILVAGLYHDISLRDDRIKLLESKGDSRFSKGFQVGVGGCLGAHGPEGCIYLGYGFQVRVP